jgi:hypothetical protein
MYTAIISLGYRLGRATYVHGQLLKPRERVAHGQIIVKNYLLTGGFLS